MVNSAVCVFCHRKNKATSKPCWSFLIHLNQTLKLSKGSTWAFSAGAGVSTWVGSLSRRLNRGAVRALAQRQKRVAQQASGSRSTKGLRTTAYHPAPPLSLEVTAANKAIAAAPAQPAGRKRTSDEACPSPHAVHTRARLRGARVGSTRDLTGMAFRQALQLAACGLAGGSAAVLFSAVAVGKPRAGGDAEPRVVEPPAWAGTSRPGPGVWDPNWDRCGASGGSPSRALAFPSGRCGGSHGGAGGAGLRAGFSFGSRREAGCGHEASLDHSSERQFPCLPRGLF